jgi:hypothetical protein
MEMLRAGPADSLFTISRRLRKPVTRYKNIVELLFYL